MCEGVGPGVCAPSHRGHICSVMFNLLSADRKQAKGTELNSRLLWEERVPKNIVKSDTTSLCFLRENGAGGGFSFLGDIFSVPNCVQQ